MSAIPAALFSLLVFTSALSTVVPHSVQFSGELGTCLINEFTCASDGNCIKVARICDGSNDCQDGSDEKGCPGRRECSATDFRCQNGQCIPSWRRCDGTPDCADSSDEEEVTCGTSGTCHPDLFACKNRTGTCIPAEWRCDRVRDCADGSDEEDCPNAACSEDAEFACRNGRCVLRGWRCDGDDDCGDGSDEEDCPRVVCSAFKFECGSGECVPSRFRCDGRRDCRDGSDEGPEACQVRQCRDGEFACGLPANACIPVKSRCDGYEDCPDGSDEKGCRSLDCVRYDISCDNGQCVRIWTRCDGQGGS